jgi:type IV secretory pathway VirB4 component
MTGGRLLQRRRRRPARVPVGLPGPQAVQVDARWLRAGDAFHRTLAVTGYPREVTPGWLQPLLDHPGPIDVALHVEPVPTVVAAERLRRQLARLESSQRLDAANGRLDDPQVEAAAHDARQLARRLASGDGRLFRVGLYVTVAGHTHAELHQEVASVQGLLGSLLLDAHPTTFRALQGWLTTLPLGLDQLRLRRTMDTTAVAAAFPFASSELPPPPNGGVLLGRNLRTGGLVCWDRWSQPNYNQVILARSGAGKSYLAKLEALRWLYQGVQVLVVDSENEYERLTGAVGGAYLRLGAPGVHLNPFDLGGEADALTRRALFAHTLLGVLLGGPLDAAASAVVDRAVIAAYTARGVSSDPRTHPRPAPLLADLARALEADPDPAGAMLAARLAPYVSGSHRGLFQEPTSTHPDRHLVVFCLRDLPEELKAAGTLLALDALWRRVTDRSRPGRRLVIVDEAWLLAQQPPGARFLGRLAKSARKHGCGLSVVTQDAGDLLASELGQVVVANAATHILLGQAPQAIDRLTSAFGLTEGERQLLLAARVGEGLLAGPGGQRAAFTAVASPAEHPLVTTSPEFLASLERSGENSRGDPR